MNHSFGSASHAIRAIGICAILCASLSAAPPVLAATADKALTYTLERNIAYRTDAPGAADGYMKERCRLDLYHPAGSPGYATVVWFHGGGLASGERAVPDDLKNRGIAVAAVSYRLSPKAKCPEYLDDAAASVAWVLKNIARYGGNPDLVFVSGHSAGGYLTCMVGLDKRWLARYGADANRIAGLIPLSGQVITHFTIRKERGIPDKQPVVDEFAPLFHVRADLPPLVLITGDRELEMLGRYEENAYLARMMKVVTNRPRSMNSAVSTTAAWFLPA